LVALGERTVPTGQELLAEFIQYGNQQPFEEIVRRYAGMIFNVCFRVTKDKHEAEDATQAVFLTLALQARRGADIKALGPWLQQVAKRLSLDSRRSKKRRKTREERHQVEQTIRRESILGDTLPSADMDELKAILHEELEKLPAKYRLPLILHYFGGLSRDEMAAELNCKPSTLGVRIFRGREMLAGRLSGRGINISAGVLAAAMSYAVKRAISDNMIAATSHAATAMMAGYDGSAFASANVIGLTRRATSALAFGKVRITAITLMMAATSLGAGAKALGVLPQLNLQRLISNQLNNLLRPLLNPLSRPLRVDSQSLPAQPSSQNLAAASTSDLSLQIPAVTATPAATPAVALLVKPVTITIPAVDPLSPGSASRSTAQVALSAPARLTGSSAEDRGTTGSLSTSIADAFDSSAPTGGGGSPVSLTEQTISRPPASPVANSITSTLNDFTFNSNNLVVGAGYANATNGHSALAVSRNGSSAANSANGATASPVALVRIPVLNGALTLSSTGILDGYGTTTKTGTLINFGQVVADGNGVDRTLNLSSFTLIQSGSSAQASAGSPSTPPGLASTSPAAPAPTADPNAFAANAINTEGWYAVNHGQLSMGLQSGPDKSVLTWGENPASTQLSLVNSVRLHLIGQGPGGVCPPVPAGFQSASQVASQGALPELSLLATDRSDVPDPSGLGGVAIGLWQVDPTIGSLPDVDITVCYDAMLAEELGASSSSIELWTLGDAPDSTWDPVQASTELLDTTDHLISGYGEDVSYFAVTAIAAPGTDVDRLIADHLSQVGGQPAPSISGVPEPVTVLPLLAMGLGLLGRRRRHRITPT